MAVRIINQRQVEALLDADALLDALDAGFRALSAGAIVAPERNEVALPDGFMLAMPAWSPGHAIAIKLVSIFHGNHERGLPGHQALICLFDPETGSTVAVMDGTAITALRTAGGAAASIRLLARPEARTLAIIGAGAQGAAHLALAPRVRPVDDIRIASLYPADAEALAAQDPRARAVDTAREAAAGADIVCLCTTSGSPVVALGDLAPGAHVTSVGYFPPGGELDPAIVRAGRLFVETRLAFAPPPVGCDELGGLDASVGTELGEVLAGGRPGRRSPAEITVYKSMGHAVEDMVAAQLVFDRAVRDDVGQLVDI